MRTPGVSVARKLRTMGLDASDTARLHIDVVRVPQRFRIGEEGLGFSCPMAEFQFERRWAAPHNAAMARRGGRAGQEARPQAAHPGAVAA